jgi:two-component system KDP operon response regulator KdpE
MNDTTPVVLLIDDDLQIRRFLRAGFNLEHFKVLEEETGEAGLRSATLRSVDLIIVDLNLPDMDGAEIVKRIRAWSIAVVKPFSMVELLARARAALRRHARTAQSESVVNLGRLSVDLANRAVFVDTARIPLSPKEYRLVQVLAQHAGNVVTHNHLVKEIWGVRGMQNAHYLRILVRRLRRKIEQNPKQPRSLVSELGVGYRLTTGD